MSKSWANIIEFFVFPDKETKTCFFFVFLKFGAQLDSNEISLEPYFVLFYLLIYWENKISIAAIFVFFFFEQNIRRDVLWIIIKAAFVTVDWYAFLFFFFFNSIKEGKFGSLEFFHLKCIFSFFFQTKYLSRFISKKFSSFFDREPEILVAAIFSIKFIFFLELLLFFFFFKRRKI